MININGVEYLNLEEQVQKNKDDIAELQEASYTAGTGIIIDGDEISVDTDTIATVDYVDESVTGFVTQDEVEDMLEDYQPKLTAGDGITINASNEISTKVGQYLFYDDQDRITLNNAAKAAIEAVDTKSTVSGTNNAGYWRTLTIDGTTNTIPEGVARINVTIDSSNITIGAGQNLWAICNKYASMGFAVELAITSDSTLYAGSKLEVDYASWGTGGVDYKISGLVNNTTYLVAEGHGGYDDTTISYTSYSIGGGGSSDVVVYKSTYNGTTMTLSNGKQVKDMYADLAAGKAVFLWSEAITSPGFQTRYMFNCTITTQNALNIFCMYTVSTTSILMYDASVTSGASTSTSTTLTWTVKTVSVPKIVYTYQEMSAMTIYYNVYNLVLNNYTVIKYQDSNNHYHYLTPSSEVYYGGTFTWEDTAYRASVTSSGTWSVVAK